MGNLVARVSCSMLLAVLLSPCVIAIGQEPFLQALADSALVLTQAPVRYDPKYYRIPYPDGDVPPDRGVCTDVVIRAYRKLGVDLQRLVHEDMKANFGEYPRHWSMQRTDRNIDHRRVPNLMVFFRRYGTTLTPSRIARDYRPGDIVCWKLAGGATHIGLVSRKHSPDGERPMIIHNIGAGQVLEDCLFTYRIIGHFRYSPVSR